MLIGDLFDGRYLIMRKLGQGGMGSVYLAQNINTGGLWAIKEIPGEDNTDFDVLSEVKLLKRLEHPALPRLFDVIGRDGKLYMISDYIDGTPLDKKIEKEGRIAENIVIGWALQICDVLDYLHSQKPNPVIYRDLKPSNIILSDSGAIKLIDFGIAREYKPRSPGDTVYIGTRGYAAPEQYGTGQTSAASDIYSLGATLHHLLTGRAPAESPCGLRPARQYAEDISSRMEAIICKCTRENPSERYQSAAQLRDELEALHLMRTQAQGGHVVETVGVAGSSRYPKAVLGSLLHAAAETHEELAAGESAHKDADRDFGGVPFVPDVHSFFRKLVITVWGNAEFGCEFAYMAAKHVKCRVLLADLDLLAPKADLYLNVGRYNAKPYHGGMFGRSGLEAALDAAEKGLLNEELLQGCAAMRKDLKNLYVLTGNCRLEDYEHYNESGVRELIEKCGRCFDITILLVNRSIYDAFTLAALLHSDINMAAVRGDIDQLREYNSYIDFLNEKQRLSVKRNWFVLFEYDKAVNITQSEAREAARGNLAGTVSPSRRRQVYRNLNSAYAARMEKNIEKEYIKLLTAIGLLNGIKPPRPPYRPGLPQQAGSRARGA